MSRPTREQMAARAAGPGGMARLRKLREELDAQRAEIAPILAKGKETVAELQAVIDDLDAAQADIAAILGELKA